MHTRFTIISLITLLFFVIASCKNKDEIKRQFKDATALKMEQFKGVPPRDNLRFIASTAYGISLECDDGKNVDTYKACRATWLLDESLSWIRTDRFFDSVRLLEHESGHLRLAMIQAKKISNNIVKNGHHQFSDKVILEVLISRAEKDLADVQSKYDQETSHGTNVFMQNKWDSLLIEDLITYYKTPSEIIKFQCNNFLRADNIKR